MLRVYIKDRCVHCRQLMEDFDRQKLRYEVYNISRNLAALEKIKKEYSANQVPVVVEGGRLKSIGYQGRG